MNTQQQSELKVFSRRATRRKRGTRKITLQPLQIKEKCQQHYLETNQNYSEVRDFLGRQETAEIEIKAFCVVFTVNFFHRHVEH